MVLVIVALLYAHIYHARQSRAISCRKCATVEVDVAHHVGVDGTYISLEVLGIVYRRAIEGDIVLVVVAATHEKPCGAISTGLHTGKLLERLQYIGLAKKYRNGQYLPLAHGDGTHLR